MPEHPISTTHAANPPSEEFVQLVLRKLEVHVRAGNWVIAERTIRQALRQAGHDPLLMLRFQVGEILGREVLVSPDTMEGCPNARVTPSSW